MTTKMDDPTSAQIPPEPGTQAAGTRREHLKERAGHVKERAAEYSHRAEDRFNQTTTQVGGGVQRFSQSIERGGHVTAERIGRFGSYLQDRDFRAMSDDLTEVIRRNPMKSIAVGVGVGFLFGRMITR